MREITLVLPHFCNLGMLLEQQKVWSDYPETLRSRLHVVVVDDCSPKGHRPSPKAVTVEGLASFRIYRLLEHTRWNWLACRNLGVKVATTDWLLLTDMDHVLPVETLKRILDGPLSPKDAYKFARRDAARTWPYALDECPKYKPHNDSFLLTKAIFNYDDGMKFVCGYDERLSGCYGTSGEFRDRVAAVAAAMVALPDPLIRYPREIISDASTHPSVYTRKGDPVNDEELRQRKEERARIPGWRPRRGLVRHEMVYTSDMKAVAV